MDVHFNAYKARFDTMDQIMRPILSSHNIRSVNVYINLDDVIHTLHKPFINLEFQTAGINSHKQFIMNVLNLLGHYRQWCIRKGLVCRIIGVYTTASKIFKNNMYITDYRKKFSTYMDEVTAEFYFINDAIRNSIKLMNIIASHIDKVYLINSKYIEPSVLPLYISKNMLNADWNILISRDLYDLQYSYRDKWTYISPKGDNTRSINNTSLWNYIKIKENVYDDMSIEYSTDLFPIVLSLVGDTYRNIPRLKRCGWKTVFKYLNQLYTADIPLSEISLQVELIKKITNNVTSLVDALNKNLESVNIELQESKISETDAGIIKEQLIDMPDVDTLLELNKKYLTLYPLNLPFLTNATVTKKNPFV